MKKLSVIDPHKFVVLANTHINHYNKLIDSNVRNVNKSECQNYIQIWESVLSVRGEWAKMTEAAKIEILDAARCGEYNEVLGITDDFIVEY